MSSPYYRSPPEVNLGSLKPSPEETTNEYEARRVRRFGKPHFVWRVPPAQDHRSLTLPPPRPPTLPTERLPSPPPPPRPLRSFADLAARLLQVRGGAVQDGPTGYDWGRRRKAAALPHGPVNYQWGATSGTAVQYMSLPTELPYLTSESYQRRRRWAALRNALSAAVAKANTLEDEISFYDGERKRIRVIGKGGVKYLPVEDHLPFEQSRKMNETLGISRLRLNRVNDDNAYFQTMSVFLEGLALDYDPRPTARH